MAALSAGGARAAASPADADAQAETAPEPIVITEGLALGPMPQQRRSPVHVDPVEHRIVTGQWQPPTEGETVTLPDGETRTWTRVKADDHGVLADDALYNGYLWAHVKVPSDCVMLLHARQHSLVYVNGEPRAGDPYNTGWMRLPVRLRAGDNELLFRCARGRVRAELTEPAAPYLLDTSDTTLPDLLAQDQQQEVLGAVVVLNATPQPVPAGALVCKTKPADEVGVATLTQLPELPPLGRRKVPISFRARRAEPTDKLPCLVQLADTAARTAANRWEDRLHDTAELTIRVRKPDEAQRRTFVSGIDGSVQYYAVQTAGPRAEGDPEPGLILATHGAGVEAAGLVGHYARKPWAHVVCPTNRRHFGFDWEDWGRLDFIEVFEDAGKWLEYDPQRVYLTGHSMGGHGVWHLGATFPGLFAALGPSAGWISFWSYTGAARYEDASPIEALLRRATAASDTLSLSRNYLQHGIYILHGDADDNVPVEQARTMRTHLAEYHADFAYYEKPGAGHWWGSPCVDWPPMLDFFRHHARPEPAEVRHVAFVTANPAVSARCDWVTIAAQVEPMLPSRVDIQLDADARTFTGSTENVRRLALDLMHVPEGTLAMSLDGTTLTDIARPAGEPSLWLARSDEVWRVIEPPSPALKSPDRSGPFKQAFRNHMVFIYGTKGSDAENAWSLAKARYDAETFGYRGNGSVGVVPDVAFVTQQWRTAADANVILYGNARTNGAWSYVLGSCPVRIEPGVVKLGGRHVTGDDLACLFVYPRTGSARALVGVIGGTGVTGMRLTDRLPYFVSGVGYPDWLVMGPEVLLEGTAGIRGTGYFGDDWSVEAGPQAWSDEEAEPQP